MRESAGSAWKDIRRGFLPLAAFAVAEGNQLSGAEIPWLSELLFLAGAILFILWALSFVPKLASVLPLVRNWRYLPLKDASQIVYDATRHHTLVHVSRDVPDEDPVHTVARYALTLSPAVYGRLRSSTVYDEIPKEHLQNSPPLSEDCSVVGSFGSGPIYEGLRVKRKDIPAIIAEMNRFQRMLQ